MKLIDFKNFRELNEIRAQMGAKLTTEYNVSHQQKHLTHEDLTKLTTVGIDVSLDDISILDDNTLEFNGNRVLLYIRDIASYSSKEQTMPRFHISYCNVLDDMKKKGRWGKYVVSTREDGYFMVRFDRKTHKPCALSVCQLCLEMIGWKAFSIRRMDKQLKENIVSSFKISMFFEKYPKSLFSVKPEYNSDSAPYNDYTNDWSTVSENEKRAKNYTCQADQCGSIFHGDDRKYLHVHHINGLKYDNNSINLKVLCISCHSNEPNHGFMKSSYAYKEYIYRTLKA
jgi:hypothetical protein